MNWQEDIHEQNNRRKLNIIKSFVDVDDELEKAKNRKVGEVHPNGKWVWKEYAPGKFDWRGNSGASKTSSSPAPAKAPEAEQTGWDALPKNPSGKEANFTFNNKKHFIKKIDDDGIVHTTEGKMFKLSTLKKNYAEVDWKKPEPKVKPEIYTRSEYKKILNGAVADAKGDLEGELGQSELSDMAESMIMDAKFKNRAVREFKDDRYRAHRNNRELVEYVADSMASYL